MVWCRSRQQQTVVYIMIARDPTQPSSLTSQAAVYLMTGCEEFVFVSRSRSKNLGTSEPKTLYDNAVWLRLPFRF